MVEQVLSDEQRCPEHAEFDGNCESCEWHRTKTLAVVAALAARSGVDVERVLDNIATASQEYRMLLDDQGEETALREAVSAHLRLALATAEARHEADETYYDLQRERDALKEREAMWREYAEHCSFQNWTDKTKARVTELRRALGLEG